MDIGFGWGDLKRKKTLWKPLRRWDDNIIVNHKATGLEGVGLISLKQRQLAVAVNTIMNFRAL
jgi:hypothetical protein